MSAPAGPAPAPVSEVPLACHLDPDQWFDRAARTASLAACLACPFRRWCARRALQYRPSWGMWAGVWIDGRFAPVAGHIEAIAADAPLPHSAAVVAAPPSRPPARRPVAEPPVGARCSDTARTGAKTVGMGPIQRSLRNHVHRMRVVGGHRRLSGSRDNGREMHRCCSRCARHCAKTLHDMDSQMAHRLGYRLDDVGAATSTPFFWRQAHRLLLCADGSLQSATDRHGQPETVADLTAVNWSVSEWHPDPAQPSGSSANS